MIHAAMPSRLVVVRISYDPEAAVWYVDRSDIPGLRAEAPTADELMSRIPGMIVDLLEENGLDGVEAGQIGEVPIEIIASHGTRVRLTEAA